MIQQGACTVFKVNLASGNEDFAVGSTYTYKMALYTASANLDSTTTVYTATGETSATGWSARGRGDGQG